MGKSIKAKKQTSPSGDRQSNRRIHCGLHSLSHLPMKHRALKPLRTSGQKCIVSVGYNHSHMLLAEESLEMIRKHAGSTNQVVKIQQEKPHCLWIIQPKQRRLLVDKGIAV